jgi:hypothetical protein
LEWTLLTSKSVHSQPSRTKRNTLGHQGCTPPTTERNPLGC